MLPQKRLSRFKNQHTRSKPKYIDDVAQSARSLSQHAAQARAEAKQTAPASHHATQHSNMSMPPAPRPPMGYVATPTLPDLHAAQLSNEGADMIPVHVVMQAMASRLAS